MRKIVLLLFLFSPMLFSLDYFGDDESKAFNASINSFDYQVSLKEENSLTIDLTYPKGFKVKSVAYEYDDSEFIWRKNEIINQREEDGQIKTQAVLSYEAMQPGKRYLNLPTLHFVSEEEPQRYITLHPPLVECEVINDLESSKTLFSKGVLDLDLRKSIELDSHNKKNLVQLAEKEIEQAKLNLTPKGYSRFWLTLIFCLAIIALGYFLLKRWQSKRSIAGIFTPQKDPKIIAMEELNRLKGKMLPQKGFFEEFYIEITQIIRKYIERQYQIKAPEQTTQEFLIKVIDTPIFETQVKSHLEEFLKFADLVKFAKLHPEISDCSQAEENAESFILSQKSET